MTPFSAIHPDEEVGGQGDLIMHAELSVDGAAVLFASDIPSGMEITRGEDTPLSVACGPDQLDPIKGYRDRLAAGATVRMPLETVP